MESEFGKGLVICLVKFSEHMGSWRKTSASYKELSKEHPDLFNESHAVEMFFNGASDHLYEIEVPQEWIKTEIGKKVRELQDFGLEIGHGFTGKKWTEAEVFKAQDLTHEIALLIDKAIGLNPEEGQW
jgi:hypothetical protein